MLAKTFLHPRYPRNPRLKIPSSSGPASWVTRRPLIQAPLWPRCWTGHGDEETRIAPPAVRSQVLSRFGFHWNNVRKCWQHPCGHVTTGTPKEPREKYESYFPVDLPSSPQTYNGPARTAEQVAA